MDTVYIARVVPLHVRNGVTRYEIFARDELEQISRLRFSTLNALKASLCERAAELGRQVRIGSRDTKYGPEIVTVELEGVAS